jgi:tetratricopeptide (TPR) repeat protein
MDSEPAKAVLWLISEFLDGESIRLLEAFSFLSSGPVGFETIASIFDLTEAKAIFGLMGDAWLEKASPTSLKMHPLIAQAVRAKAMGSQESMRAYFSRFILASRPDALSAAQRLQTLPHAVSFAKWMNNSSAQKARLLANIAQLFGGLRDYGRAQAAFDRALGVLSATEGLKHPFAATLYRSYASTMKAGGQYQKAAQLYDKSAELCMEKYGEGSLALSDTYMDSIGVLVYLDSLDEAMRRAREAHRILSAKFGDSEAATWAAMEKIGLVTLAMGRPGDAIDILESASRALRELLGPSSEALACAWIDLAQAYQADGDYVKSYFFAMRSLDMLKKGKPKNSSLLAKAYATLGRHFQFLQEYDQAVGFMKDALSSLRKAYAENHPEMSLCYLALGRLHREMGMEGKAANYFSRYLSIKEKTVGKNTPAQAFKNIGAVYMELGNKSLTLNYYSKALNIAVNAKGKNHALTAGAYNDLGLAYMYFGEYGASLSNFGKALKIFALLYGENDSTAAVIYNNMALACQNMNDTGSAVEYYARSLAIKEAVLGKRDPHTLSTYSNLYGLYKKMGDSFNADYYKTLFMENGGNSKMIEGEFEI